MALWWEWFRCVQALRAACARRRTFLWMVLVLAGLSIRLDRAGVSSMVRALGLKAACYRRLLYVCHSPGMCIERLRACWTRLALTLFTPVRLGGLETFGLLGLFLGPAVMAAFISVWRDWTEASS